MQVKLKFLMKIVSAVIRLVLDRQRLLTRTRPHTAGWWHRRQLSHKQALSSVPVLAQDRWSLQ